MDHSLHKKIGGIIIQKNFKGFVIIKDSACKTLIDVDVHNLPLFCSQLKSNATEYCNVDILILKREKISVIIEIDESDIKPTQICGKFLTSALCSFYMYNDKKYEMDDSVLFLQIVDINKLAKNSSKILQFDYLEEAIHGLLPLKRSKISKYTLLKVDANTAISRDLINRINKHLIS